MRIVRLGRAPVKGLRQDSVDSLTVDAEGVLGDRAAAVVDAQTLQVLKSVHHPSLLGVRAAVADDEVRLWLPDGGTARQPLAAGEPARVTYWGRPEPARVSDGPAARALSAFLGRRVLLAPAPRRRAFVWEAPVSVVLVSEVAALAERLAEPHLAWELGRYRANVVLDDTGLSSTVTVGSRLHAGRVVLELGRPIDRCAVVNHHPEHGAADRRVLAAMAAHRREADKVVFGLQAKVLAPGTLVAGGPVTFSAR